MVLRTYLVQDRPLPFGGSREISGYGLGTISLFCFEISVN